MIFFKNIFEAVPGGQRSGILSFKIARVKLSAKNKVQIRAKEWMTDIK